MLQGAATEEEKEELKKKYESAKKSWDNILDSTNYAKLRDTGKTFDVLVNLCRMKSI